MALKHDEILCNEGFQNAVYLSTQMDGQISLYSFINELQKIYKEVGNGPITFSCVPEEMKPDSKERRIILSVATADKKIHSFYIHN